MTQRSTHPEKDDPNEEETRNYVKKYCVQIMNHADKTRDGRLNRDEFVLLGK